ncbi:MAG: bacteriocin transport accessory protein [Lachnospiraceae bacterium]|nr:bacteriocin transport accessory protein [Lachnospiraceae bacterium]
MKKRLILITMTCMMLSLVGCGNQENANDMGNDSAEVGTESVAGDDAKPEGDTPENEVVIGDALEILTTVWGTYEEADKFPVAGGDSANQNFEGPAVFDATNAEELDVTLGFPTAQVENIDDAASMMNAMMANNFTAGVYHVKAESKEDVEVVATAIKDNIMAKQWMCGMPEKMVIIVIDDYVVSAFGLGDTIDVFKTKVTEAYGNAYVLYEEVIAQ